MALDLSEIERKAVPHLTQWPPSKLSHSQEVGCSMLLLYTSFAFPFCLCASFPSNTTKHGFSLRFQLGFGMMSSCPTLCGHSKNILPSASSRTGWGCWIPFSCHHKETSVSRLSFVQILACLGEVRCLHLIVIGIDWHLLKFPGGKKAKLTRGDYPLHSSNWMWRAAFIQCTAVEGPPCLFLLVVVHIWTERVLPAERTWRKSLSK